MKFTDALNVVHQIHWDYANTFEVFFSWNPVMLGNSRTVPASISYEADAAQGNVLAWNINDNQRLSLHIIDIQLPQLSYNTLSSFTGNRWTHHSGQQQEFEFSMRFRDSNQLEFYRLFATQYREQDYRYFDDVYFDVFVSKDSDYGDAYHIDSSGDVNDYTQPKELISLKRCLIKGVSAITFSNDIENQHVEFNVDFIANDIELYDGGSRQFYSGNGKNTYAEHNILDLQGTVFSENNLEDFLKYGITFPTSREIYGDDGGGGGGGLFGNILSKITGSTKYTDFITNIVGGTAGNSIASVLGDYVSDGFSSVTDWLSDAIGDNLIGDTLVTLVDAAGQTAIAVGREKLAEEINKETDKAIQAIDKELGKITSTALGSTIVNTLGGAVGAALGGALSTDSTVVDALVDYYNNEKVANTIGNVVAAAALGKVAERYDTTTTNALSSMISAHIATALGSDSFSDAFLTNSIYKGVGSVVGSELANAAGLTNTQAIQEAVASVANAAIGKQTTDEVANAIANAVSTTTEQAITAAIGTSLDSLPINVQNDVAKAVANSIVETIKNNALDISESTAEIAKDTYGNIVDWLKNNSTVVTPSSGS